MKQKHSRSRLGITRELFEASANLYSLDEACACAVACFGVPGGEDELGPPPPTVRWTPTSSEKLQLGQFHLCCTIVADGFQRVYVYFDVC